MLTRFQYLRERFILTTMRPFLSPVRWQRAAVVLIVHYMMTGNKIAAAHTFHRAATMWVAHGDRTELRYAVYGTRKGRRVDAEVYSGR